jgi:pilus assembly protein CpaB
MGFEASWQRELSRRWRARQLGRMAREERRGTRPATIIMLVAAAGLGLVALWLSHSLPGRGPMVAARPALRTVPVVVAAADINFGERLAPDRLKLVDWPASAVPAGVFNRIDELATGQPQAAIRPIAAGEVILASALAGNALRLSTAPLLPPNLRAMAVPVNDVSGVSGLVYPGDRVDLFLSRQPDEAQPHAELVAQDLRVLAVGPDMNVGRDKPEPVRSVTLAVTPLQAQKISLAITTGQLSLALRHFSDDDRIRLQTVQVMDLNDGTTTRLLKRPGAGGPPAANPPPRAAAPAATAPRDGVIVMRGTEASVQSVLPQ